MKTPEHWRNSRDPCCKVPFGMMDRHTQTISTCSTSKLINHEKSRFFTWWPWPMTIELGLDIMKVHLHTKIRVRNSNGSARRPLNYRQTHTRAHTHTPDRFYYLDHVADVGGNNDENILMYSSPALHSYFSVSTLTKGRHQNLTEIPYLYTVTIEGGGDPPILSYKDSGSLQKKSNYQTNDFKTLAPISTHPKQFSETTFCHIWGGARSTDSLVDHAEWWHIREL